MEAFQEMKMFLSELNGTLQNLFQCGFASVPDSLFQQIKKYSLEAKDYGLSFAAKELQQLYNKLQASRHQFQTDYRETATLYCGLVQYLRTAERRLEWMSAKDEAFHRDKGERCEN